MAMVSIVFQAMLAKFNKTCLCLKDVGFAFALITESIRTSVLDDQFPAKNERSKSYDEGLDDYKEGKR